jgi:hypothetical protein
VIYYLNLKFKAKAMIEDNDRELKGDSKDSSSVFYVQHGWWGEVGEWWRMMEDGIRRLERIMEELKFVGELLNVPLEVTINRKKL